MADYDPAVSSLHWDDRAFDAMESISTDTMLQITVTVVAALALWLRLDSKIDALRKELKGDIKEVDDKATKISEASNQYHLEIIERLTQVDEKVECIIRGEPLKSD